MKGQEIAPINNVSLAVLLETFGSPLNIILGRPAKGKKLKIKQFSMRVQKPASNKRA
jgi:hypothetical protein